ncbi:Glycosyltransferase, GT2 family [Nonlabens sp. Hel1_33_55]|uniref:glycosyltransferase family 2 protein n=1 Tax=Nonlabens sp. Hel1_33_55 TaxID=1336802 RepID=UPI000875A9A4|nr:glycosyltransferase [Nonlabens sp. Hel1_33_55]SCX87229.1 Glycosyltransferase, GT2 family [Nonlabens sp. Hel1_33_55]
MARYTTDDLEILIATIAREDLSFLEAIFSQPLESIVHNILIVNQSKTSQLKSDFHNIRVINDVNPGLSRSRNIAIENSIGKILWIMDDDCLIADDAVNKIVDAHSSYKHEVIVFQTTTFDNELIRTYSRSAQSLSHSEIKKILSPEITLKKASIIASGLSFDVKFGLGAQFQDSENYVFFLDLIRKGIPMFFVPEIIVSHTALTSSNEVESNRLIYARGALAAKIHPSTARFYQWKYVFFLWRKGYVTSFTKLVDKFRIFGQGIEDYNSGR